MNLVWKRRWGLSLLIAASMAVQAKDFTMAEIHPPTHPVVKSEELFASRVNQLTGSAIQIQLKHSGQLGNEDQAWAGIKGNKIEVTRLSFATLSKDVPAASLLGLPYLFRSRDHMWRVMDGDFGKRIVSEVEKAGAIVLGYYDSGTRSFYMTKKPIRIRSDFAGQRIRVMGTPVFKDLITMLGATPVVMPFDKVAAAMANGEIDGAENNIPSYVSSGHHKVAPYFSFDEHSSVPEVLLISKKAWDGLNDDQKKAMRTAADESVHLMKKLWAEAEARDMETAKKAGVTFIEKSQIGISGIEAFAIKVYSKHVTNVQDLDSVLKILNSE